MMKRERLRFWCILATTLLVCWAWIIAMARDMYGEMSGASAWMMRTDWDLLHLTLLWAMWAVMMAAMMLPAAIPILMLYMRSVRNRAGESQAQIQVYALAAGYIAIWSSYSMAATVLQWGLGTINWLTPMMEPAMPIFSAAVLLMVGVYQLTPFKRACLQTCRSPISFLMQRWRLGPAGAFRMGWEHGLYCLGCCWALMLLLFVGGVMNLFVIAALTGWVILEKATPFGEQLARISGGLLIAAGGWMLMT